ncbi:MAG TPA: YdcF family protein [Flavihumibacter sp.]
MTKSVEAAARLIWDYHQLKHELTPADCLLALGSHDLRVAQRAAELWLDGMAPVLVMSGGLGNFTLGMWTEKEADRFAAVAVKMGVPGDAILVENQSTNTGENIQFSKKLLAERGLDPQKFIVIQKPYMERRSYATFKKHWPDKELLVTSPQISFDDYPNEEIPLERVINIMVGDLQRIREYPALGFQIEQEIPAGVWAAYELLVAAGYDKHLIR